jgi:glycosyltransferase involved in cell wall biosynthesis
VKLLYVLENYWPHVGGMETLMGQICRRMAERSHEVTVVTRSVKNAPTLETKDGVKILRVTSPGGRYTFPLAALRAVLGLARDCDIIHTTTFTAAPLGSFVGFVRRKPVVLTVPELWIGKWHTFSDATAISSALFDISERAIFAFPFDAYIGISNYTTERLRAYLGTRRSTIRTIYCGFDPTPWRRPVDVRAIRASLGVADEEFLILSYGRPGMSKGFRYLVDAFPRIAEVVPNVRLHLILSDSQATSRELAELKRRADARIVFHRPLPFDTLTGVVRSANCVVIPSLAEGFGYATLEAATSGVPLVVSETASIPEVLGGRYQFAKPRDVESIVHAVGRISGGVFLQREIPRFDWDDTIRAYEAVYEAAGAARTKKWSGSRDRAQG